MSNFLLDKPDVEAHLKTLGFDRVLTYRLWCYHNGLDTGLDKTAAQRQVEIDLLQREVEQRDPDVSPRHNAHRGQIYCPYIQRRASERDCLRFALSHSARFTIISTAIPTRNKHWAA